MSRVRWDDWVAVERLRAELLSWHRVGVPPDQLARRFHLGARTVLDLLGAEYERARFDYGTRR